MAIRMKEWGMLSYPRQGVHLPLNALNDWGRSGRVLGQGVTQAGSGAAELANAIYRVQKAGSEADMASAFEQIGRETTEELLELPVRDWDYSWQQAYAPRVQEVLNQYSGADRERALQLSEVYGHRHSLNGRRRMELERIRQEQLRKEQDIQDTAVTQVYLDEVIFFLHQLSARKALREEEQRRVESERLQREQERQRRLNARQGK